MSWTLVQQTAQRIGRANRRHGARNMPEYKAWLAMKGRCLNQSYKSYPGYGGRGIAVCERWLASSDAFLSDMGPRPSPAYSLDRIDNDGDYTPANCRWATRSVQQRNKRARRVVWCGTTWTLAEAARSVGLSPQTVAARIKRGWTVDDALGAMLDEGAAA